MPFKRETRFNSLSELVKYQDLKTRHVEGIDSRDPLTSWKKNQYRKSPEWKFFCKQLIEKRIKCERCGSVENLCVHHQDPKNYSDLTETKFKVLCPACHLKIESFCSNEEQMKRCPNIDKKFLTLYPYQDKTVDVLARQSGYYVARKWMEQVDASSNSGKYLNTVQVSEKKKEGIKQAINFMKEHPELFK